MLSSLLFTHFCCSQMVVDDKCAKMEAAAEEDMEQHEAGRPAVQKLKMLAEVDDFLAQVYFIHRSILHLGPHCRAVGL